MTLDRDTARALFDNAEPMPATANDSPFAPQGGGYDRINSKSARKGVDWRFVAPVGVAAVFGAGALLIAGPDRTETGKIDAVAPVAVAARTPVAPPPIETAEVAPPATLDTTSPAPTLRAAAATPARKPAPRIVAQRPTAPSAMDEAADVSAREPYVPGPSQIVTPAAPPPVVTPEPDPVTPPSSIVVPPATEPEPITPPQ